MAEKAKKEFRSSSWDEALGKLPGYLSVLLDSPVYGRGPDRTPAPRSHGVYLFTEKGKHLYVGRCGLTERARELGKGHSNFRTRLAGHSCPGSAHNQATFAWRLTLEALGESIMSELPATRRARQGDPAFKKEFFRQKERVTAMDFRIVEIADDLESYVFEPYSACELQTPYNFWATS